MSRGGGGGGYKTGGGRHVKFYPYEKGWVAEKVLDSHAEGGGGGGEGGGHKQFWGSFYLVA